MFNELNKNARLTLSEIDQLARNSTQVQRDSAPFAEHLNAMIRLIVGGVTRRARHAVAVGVGGQGIFDMNPKNTIKSAAGKIRCGW